MTSIPPPAARRPPPAARRPPPPRPSVFMTLIEKTFGKDVTTRTWETIQKVAGA